MSDDEKLGSQVSEEHKSVIENKAVLDNKENNADIKHGLGSNLEVKEKEEEPIEDVNFSKNQENQNEKTQQIAETEWICEKCNSLNFIIYDDINSSYCNSKFFKLKLIQTAIRETRT